ncbi:Hsp20 family protein [Gluconacetobacter sacchari]|uniref:Hsp20 family protein n=2 Tax=Gluconacetobacter sacchari TaxID=92759 RepID=A0A7W4NN31_9PROT|nr:Hsp20 family protein [Gluconacetobacter sacchari]MBB2160856.1 Hsp20 family protein [Gluconacetobacter sacchari]GBQ28960.1 heat shock protein Hsp20 [Gluconacetobacter sacchari DSM 12717]
MTYDFAPLFRTAIGFDRLARLVDNAAQNPAAPSYPPYNIEKLGEDSYVLTMAVAGFGPEDIELTVQDNMLVVAGRLASATPEGEVLHRGIATRAFERRFVLADHIVVDSADMTNGLLRVAVRRFVPEALKPRRIPVGSGAPRLPADAASAPANDGATAEHAA